jgi:hypothetical protein
MNAVQARGTEAKFRKWIELLMGPSVPSTRILGPISFDR